MNDLLAQMRSCLPRMPSEFPQGFYVYELRVNGIRRYIGKGSGDRAWSHVSMVMSVFEAALQGRVVPEALYLHTMIVRQAGRKKGLRVTVGIIQDGLTSAQAYVAEEALIRAENLSVTAPSNEDCGLWNVGGHGLNVHHRVGKAEHVYKTGTQPKDAEVKRVRPGKAKRQDMKMFYGSGYGADDGRRVDEPASPHGGVQHDRIPTKH